MLTIIESRTNAWAVAATNGDLRIYCREQPGEWIEISLSDNSEQIDQDGNLLLEALYDQRIGQDQEPQAEEEEDPEAEEELEAEEEEEPEAEEEEEEPEEEGEPEEEDEEVEEEDEKEKPRRGRGRTKARKK